MVSVSLINNGQLIQFQQVTLILLLVADEQNLVKTIAAAKKVLASYSFTSGNKYSEFRDGDRITEYGLAALVGGGALAVWLRQVFFRNSGN